MTTTEVVQRANLVPVPKARNLEAIGWVEGYMLVRYRGRTQLYIYGPNIPESERDKISRNPFPDRLFTVNIAKKFRCHKVGSSV